MRIKLILSDERKPRGYLFLAQIFLLLWLEWISCLFMFHNRDAIEILGVTSKANMQEKTPHPDSTLKVITVKMSDRH